MFIQNEKKDWKSYVNISSASSNGKSKDDDELSFRKVSSK